MIVLVSNNSAVIYSGLIAAIVSGVVSLIGYSITAYIQNKNNKEALKVQKENNSDTIKIQKEIAKMQNDEKLFYEKQIEWANETRKLIAKFVTDCIELNRYIKIAHNLGEETYKGKELQKYVEKADKMSERVEELTLNLQEETTLIRLYLFHEKDNYEAMVRNKMLAVEQYFSKGQAIPDSELNVFVDVARQMFNHQMKELRTKTA